MKYIRKATADDLLRITEIIVFNYRLNFYPIFWDDDFYFNEMQVASFAEVFREDVENMWVYDDGAVKGVIQIEEKEVKRLFVEPALQGMSIGSALLEYAIGEYAVSFLWALEKNVRAISFYERHGFCMTSDKKLEEDTTEYLVRMERKGL